MVVIRGVYLFKLDFVGTLVVGPAQHALVIE